MAGFPNPEFDSIVLSSGGTLSQFGTLSGQIADGAALASEVAARTSLATTVTAFIAQKGATSGLATLDTGGNVPSGQLGNAAASTYTFAPLGGIGFTASTTTAGLYEMARRSGADVHLTQFENNSSLGTLSTTNKFLSTDAITRAGSPSGATVDQDTIFLNFLLYCQKYADFLRGHMPAGDVITVTSDKYLQPGRGPDIAWHGCTISATYSTSGNYGIITNPNGGGDDLCFEDMIMERRGYRQDIRTNLISETNFTASISTAGLMTVTGTPFPGTLYPGMFITYPGSPAGLSIIYSASATGTGGGGTYQLSSTLSTAVSSQAMYAATPSAKDDPWTLYSGDWAQGAVVVGNVLASATRAWGETAYSNNGSGNGSVISFDTADLQAYLGTTPTVSNLNAAFLGTYPIDTWMIENGPRPTVSSIAAVTGGFDFTLSFAATQNPAAKFTAYALVYSTSSTPTVAVDNPNAFAVGGLVTSTTATIPAGTRVQQKNGNVITFTKNFGVNPGNDLTCGLQRNIVFCSTPPVNLTGNMYYVNNADRQTLRRCTFRNWGQGRAFQGSGFNCRAESLLIVGSDGNAGSATTRWSNGSIKHSDFVMAGGDQVTQCAQGGNGLFLDCTYENGVAIGFGAACLALSVVAIGQQTITTWKTSTVTATPVGNTIYMDGRTSGSGGTLPAGIIPANYGTGVSQTTMFFYLNGSANLCQVVSITQPGGAGTDYVMTVQPFLPGATGNCVTSTIATNSANEISTPLDSVLCRSSTTCTNIRVVSVGNGGIIVTTPDNQVRARAIFKQCTFDDRLHQFLTNSLGKMVNLACGPYGGAEVTLEDNTFIGTFQYAIATSGNLLLHMRRNKFEATTSAATAGLTVNSSYQFLGLLPGSVVEENTFTLNGVSIYWGDVAGHTPQGEQVYKANSGAIFRNNIILNIPDAHYALEANACTNNTFDFGIDPGYFGFVSGAANTAGLINLKSGDVGNNVLSFNTTGFGAAPINSTLNTASGNSGNAIGTLIQSNSSFPVTPLAGNNLVLAGTTLTTYDNHIGQWNASTNVPALASGTAPSGGVDGAYRVVGVPGNTLIDGNSNWFVGDKIRWNATQSVWQRDVGSQALGGVQISGVKVVPANQTSGGTYTIASTTGFQILKAAGTLASLTVNLPATPVDGQQITVSSVVTITSLTVSGGAGTLYGAPTSIGPATPFSMIYDLGTTSWILIG